MEIVILDDLQATYLTNWVRIANTLGHDAIKPGDEFQENGALEEFSVEAVSFSPVPGASRIRLLRAHHSTKAEVHKAGAVLRQTNAAYSAPAMGASIPNGAETTRTIQAVVAEPEEVPASPAKRGRGRPKGSPNKPKQPLVPAWPGVS